MYAKLFASLYQGTLRGNPDEILVFTNLLAHADSTGIVDKHWRAISEEVGISRERVEAAIANLEAPDPESRSPEENGCRIVKMDEHRVWGWKIVNHGKYRAIRDEDDRREQNRIAQEKWRNKNKPSKPRKPISAQAEAEAEAEAEENKKDNSTPQKRSADTRGTRLPEDWSPSPEDRGFANDLGVDASQTADEFRDYWHAIPGAKGRKLDWSKTFRNRCREIARRPSRAQAKSFAQQATERAASIVNHDDLSQWRARLRGKMWMENLWGPRPGQPGCRVPAILLVEKRDDV